MFFVPYANEGPPSSVSSDRLWAPSWYFYTARNFDLGLYVKWRWLSGQSTGFVVERSRVRVPAGAAGELSSPGSTFCADSYFGIRSTPVLPLTVARKRSRSFCQKCRWQVTAKHAYTLRMWLLLNRASALVTTCP